MRATALTAIFIMTAAILPNLPAAGATAIATESVTGGVAGSVKGSVAERVEGRAPASAPASDRYVVVLKGRPRVSPGPAGVSRADSEAAASAKSLTGRRGGTVKRAFSTALRGFTMTGSAAQARSMAADPAVSMVLPDARVKVVDNQPGPGWGLDRVDQRSLPLNGTYAYDRTGGSGVTAYVIDTGIRPSHYDFGGRARVAVDYVGDGRGGIDCDGHGTHVAGTIGGTRWGVAKAVQLRGVRVLDCYGSGWWSDVIAGLDYVADQAMSTGAPTVANLSLGGDSYAAVDSAVANAVASGVTVVVAAGNESADACGGSPSGAPAAVTVGATDRTDTRAGFSNYGSCVDIFAPGVGILSDWNTGDAATEVLSGTSMASPHVAGLAALYLSDHPAASPGAVTTALMAGATYGAVKSPGGGSPNRLLYSGTISGVSTPSSVLVGHATYSDGSNIWITRAVPTHLRGFKLLTLPGVPPPRATVTVRVYQAPGASFRFDMITPDGRWTYLGSIGPVSKGRFVQFSRVVSMPGSGETGWWLLYIRSASRYSTSRGYLDSWRLTF